MSSLGVPTETARTRAWLRGALVAGGLLGAGLLAAVGHLFPEALPLVPLAVFALVGIGVVAACHPDVAFIGLLALSMPALASGGVGLAPTEAAFYLAYTLYLVAWYGSRLVKGEAVVRGPLDVCVVILSTAILGIGVITGVVHGAPPSVLLAEALGFSTLALFIPVREFVRTRPHGPFVIGLVLVWFGVWAAIRNALAVRRALSDATQLWEVTEVRAAGGDLLLYVAAVVALALLVSVARWRLLAGLTFAAAICVVGVMLAKSRGYWVDFALALLLLAALVPTRARLKIAGGGLAVVAIFALVVSTLLGPAASLVVTGTLRRFATIGTSTTQDVSLINRFAESAEVWSHIQVNPLAGHGFGTEFSFHNLTVFGETQYSFIHNGFLGLWFKVGLVGMLLVIGWWLACSALGIWASRYHGGLSRANRGAVLGAGVASLCLFPTVTTSNPFLTFDSLIVVVIASALSAGAFARHAPPPLAA